MFAKVVMMVGECWSYQSRFTFIEVVVSKEITNKGWKKKKKKRVLLERMGKKVKEKENRGTYHLLGGVFFFLFDAQTVPFMVSAVGRQVKW